MSRDEFIKELEYLLQDIPDEDKEDAIAYYQDYLDEAGPENEESALREFGSPERVAAIIRADLNGNLEQGGEFTDQGYGDERFKDPNYQIAPRLDLPEERAGSGEEGTEWEESRGDREGKSRRGAGRRGYGYGSESGRGFRRGSEDGQSSGYDGEKGRNSGYGEEEGRRFRYGQTGKGRSNYGEERPEGEDGRKGSVRRRWEWWQIVLLCLAAPVLLPLVLGVGGGALGLAFGVGSGAVGILITIATVLLCMAIALPVVALGILLAGIVLIIFGITRLTVLVQGILYIGTGMGLFGLGLLCVALCGLYYGRFLPWLVNAVVNFFSRLFHRKKVSV